MFWAIALIALTAYLVRRAYNRAAAVDPIHELVFTTRSERYDDARAA